MTDDRLSERLRYECPNKDLCDEAADALDQRGRELSGARELLAAGAMIEQSLSAQVQSLDAKCAELEKELAAARAIAYEYNNWIRFHDAGNGDFQDFMKTVVAHSQQEGKNG